MIGILPHEKARFSGLFHWPQRLIGAVNWGQHRFTPKEFDAEPDSWLDRGISKCAEHTVDACLITSALRLEPLQDILIES